MSLSKEQLAAMLQTEEFPLSSKYDPEWVLENQMGPSALWLTEWLCRDMDLEPGMRVLDMGCGMAMSSIFLMYLSPRDIPTESLPGPIYTLYDTSRREKEWIRGISEDNPALSLILAISWDVHTFFED